MFNGYNLSFESNKIVFAFWSFFSADAILCSTLFLFCYFGALFRLKKLNHRDFNLELCVFTYRFPNHQTTKFSPKCHLWHCCIHMTNYGQIMYFAYNVSRPSFSVLLSIHFSTFSIYLVHVTDLSLSAMFVSSVVFLVSYMFHTVKGRPIIHLHHNTLGTWIPSSITTYSYFSMVPWYNYGYHFSNVPILLLELITVHFLLVSSVVETCLVLLVHLLPKSVFNVTVFCIILLLFSMKKSSLSSTRNVGHFVHVVYLFLVHCGFNHLL